MTPKQKRFFLVLPIMLLFLLSSCRMKRSSYMTDEQKQQINNSYDSLQGVWQSLMTEYQAGTDTLPEKLQTMYGRMQNMHRQMGATHKQMMGQHMKGHMQGNKMRRRGGRSMQMQGHMTGEWYQQMRSMHRQMATMHERMGQQSMARMNRRLSKGYGKMMRKLPATDQTSDDVSEKKEKPTTLNGERLFSQNCASCHGSNAEGFSNMFPPLVNTEWVTGDKTVPIRILLNGMEGEIEVNGQSYQGVMPSFRTRLSSAEMAAILNYLRSLSDGNAPEITREDVARVRQNYKNRNQPWSAEELKTD